MADWSFLRRRFIARAVLLLMLALPSAATAVGYGINDNSLDVFGNSSTFHTLCGWRYRTCGHGGAAMQYAEIGVPYNALATYDAASSMCVSTVNDPNNYWWRAGVQQPLPQILYNWLGEAQTVGVRPLIAVSAGNSNLATESDNPVHPTAQGYLCGLEALMQAAGPGWNRWVHEWEVFNEPEAGVCASTAANYYSLALQAAAQNGRTSDTFVAGTFTPTDDPLDGSNHPDCGHPRGDWFIPDYVKAIKAAQLNPPVWAWHPYSDVGASYDGSNNTHQTGDLASYLNQQFPSHPAFWLTEAGAFLNSSAYGQYLDGSPLGQANAAQGFKNLAGAPNQAYPGQIARLYWYEYQTHGDGISSGSDHFDSALLGITSGQWADDGTGVPRASYCVLAFHESPTQAVADRRCDYATSPQIPWTDWQDPNG